jgi:hypothetical protein
MQKTMARMQKPTASSMMGSAARRCDSGDLGVPSFLARARSCVQSPRSRTAFFFRDVCTEGRAAAAAASEPSVQ